MATTAATSDSSGSETPTTTTTFAVGHRVVLHGLKGAAEHNGKVGIVQSDLNSGGRHEVELVEDGSKSGGGEKKLLGIKPINLMFEPRPLDSLSVAELKFLLTSCESSSESSTKISPKEFTGMDKSELRTKVSQMEKSTDPMDLAIRLSKRARPQSDSGNDSKNKKKTSKRSASAAASGGNTNNNMQQHHQAAEQLSNMSPEQLMQQAQMMRSMDFATLRRMNPQMANMSDAQINMAIQQLEMMAMNPSMVQQAADQMKNMSNEEFERQKQQVMGGSGGSSGASGAASPGMGSMGGNAVNPENMTPEQLKEQARMMRSMDPDTIRRMNPALANMTDDQIRMAATQMEQMAENPEMMRFAKEQMKNMSQEDIRKMQQTGTMPAGVGAGAGAGAGPPNPQQMLRDSSPEQLKQMVKMMKQNPEMMRQMLPGGGMGMNQDQINKTLEALGNMDEAQLEQTLRAAQMFQQYTAPIENAWKKANGLVGGQLRNILLLLFALSVVMLFRYLFFSSSASSAGVASDAAMLTKNDVDGTSGSSKIQSSDAYVGQEEDEFSEF